MNFPSQPQPSGHCPETWR